MNNQPQAHLVTLADRRCRICLSRVPSTADRCPGCDSTDFMQEVEAVSAAKRLRYEPQPGTFAFVPGVSSPTDINGTSTTNGADTENHATDSTIGASDGIPYTPSQPQLNQSGTGAVATEGRSSSGERGIVGQEITQSTINSGDTNVSSWPLITSIQGVIPILLVLGGMGSVLLVWLLIVNGFNIPGVTPVAEPTATSVPATMPPPTTTPVPPTATLEPPTATPVPPTATPEPPTATAEPPTATSELPTATPVLPKAQIKVGTGGVNLRSAPSTDNEPIRLLAEGEFIVLLGQEQVVGDITWVKVRAEQDGAEGWVSKEPLELLP